MCVREDNNMLTQVKEDAVCPVLSLLDLLPGESVSSGVWQSYVLTPVMQITNKHSFFYMGVEI